MKIWFDIAFILTLAILIVINFRTMLLPNVITYPGFIISVLVHSLLGRTEANVLAFFQSIVVFPVLASLLDSLVGAIIAGGTLWLLNTAWNRIRGVDVIGIGDMKMMAMIGAYLGIIDTIGVLVVSAILIVAFTIFIAVLNKSNFL